MICLPRRPAIFFANQPALASEEQGMTTTTKSTPVSIQEFAAALRKFPVDAFQHGTAVLDLMKSAPVAQDSLAPYLHWDAQHYTRNLVDKTPSYELIAICWEPGQFSSVHNHQGQNCWMAAPLGKLLVQNYRTVFEDLASGKCKLEPTDVVEITLAQPCAVDSAEPVHRVLNPREFNARAVTLHVYSKPIDSCVVYSPEKGTCGEIQLHYTSQYGHSPEK
jgi:cysteine dioxygenase